MTTRHRSYTATAQRDGNWWVLLVELPEQDRTLGTQVRRLDKAGSQVADLLATFFDASPEDFDVTVVPVLDEALRVEVEQAKAGRDEVDALKRQLDEVVAESMKTTRTAAQDLAAEGLSHRDIASLLGVSHQRISQILSEWGRKRA